MGVAVGVTVKVAVGLGVFVTVGEAVGVAVTVGVFVTVGVAVMVKVAVTVEVTVFVGVAVGVAVRVGPGEPQLDFQTSVLNSPPAAPPNSHISFWKARLWWSARGVKGALRRAFFQILPSGENQ